MSELNPYAPPAAPLDLIDRAALCELVRAWEKLRLLYNGILLLPGISILVVWNISQHTQQPVAILSGLFVGFCANIAFFLGPLTEIYLRGFFRYGAPLGKERLAIFGAGMVVSAGVLLMFGLMPEYSLNPFQMIDPRTFLN